MVALSIHSAAEVRGDPAAGRLTIFERAAGVAKTAASAVDGTCASVEGSRFELSPRPSAKLEGARLAGYETISIVGSRDPHVLARLDTWLGYLRRVLADRVRSTLGLDSQHYDLALQCYGANAVLGPLEDSAGPREIGLLLKVRARSQQTATAIAKTANPLLRACSGWTSARSPVPDSTVTLGELADQVRSRNAGPFWITLDIFFKSQDDYQLAASSAVLSPQAIGRLYRVDPATVRYFELPDILAVKISFPRSVTAGSFEDRDLHGGQQYVALADLRLPAGTRDSHS
jgi:hypothetical protein